MPGLNTPSEHRMVDTDEGPEMETLSTGLDNFDQTFERQGIRIGTLVGVFSDPVAPGDILAANMIANRPAYYYTFTRSEKQIRRDIEPVSNVDLNQTHLHSVDSETPAKTLRKKIEETTFPRGVSIVIDPVNEVEGSDPAEYKKLVQALQESVADADGLGILYGINPEVEPENRWVTKYTCDTVLEVYHRTLDETIVDYLAIQKLYYGQQLIDEDSRVFELTNELNIDIATSRNVSP